MKVKDLPNLVTASKADWLPAYDWLGFTPKGKGPGAEGQCESTIKRQFKNGYVLEYVTKGMDDPNEGFDTHPRYLEDKEKHEELKGRLVAIHRLIFSSRPLRAIIGEEQNEEIQKIWKKEFGKERWSVAFPIVESYTIDGAPLARKVFGKELYENLYRRSSATLRELSDRHRDKIANLNLTKRQVQNYWIAVEDQIIYAEASELDERHLSNLSEDLALEGETEERRTKIIKRAAWLARKFANWRRDSNALFCDDCGFDPKEIFEHQKYNPRSLLDVHHKNPIAEGERYTYYDDLALLCPTCHRKEHVRLGLEL